MATTTIMTEVMPPTIRAGNPRTNRRESGILDPVILYQKLEVAKREQDVISSRRLRRQATRDGTFVARGATQSSPPSQTPPSHKASQMALRVDRIMASPPVVRPKPQPTADGRPVMDHQSMLAALNLGLSELEAMTDRLERATTRQRELLCSRCKTSDEHEHHQTNNNTAMLNASKRVSIPPNTSHLVAVRHGSQTVYERVEIPSENPPDYDTIPYRASEDPNQSRVQRPPLQPHDRPDWTQQSQCGGGGDDDPHANPFGVPSGYIFRRRNPQPPPVADAVVPAAREVPPQPQPQPPQEMHLISDAVKLIKQKERRAKRKSVVDFLKKL